MDVNAITTLISSVGFPIFTSIVLFYYIYKTQKETNDTINQLREAIINNTNVIAKLIDHIDDKDNRDE